MSRPFQGWRVVTAAFVAQLIATGCCFSAFGVFVVPLAAEFDASRGLISSGLGLAMLVMGLLGPLLGRVIDHGPLRATMLSGVLVLAAGLLLTSRAALLWQAGLAFCGLVAVGAAMFGPLPSMSLAGNWFVRRRGLALGITVAGATLASMLAPPIAAALIEAVGWRGALVALGLGGAAIATPVLWAWVVRRPEEIGQLPDGATATSESPARALVVPDTGVLLRDPQLWLISMGFALVFASPIVMGAHLVAYAEDLGMSRLRAAAFFTVMGPFSILGKVLFGALSDRVDARHAVWLALSIVAGTWAMLLTEPGYSTLLATTAAFGLGVGAVGPIHGVVVGACFGRGAFGRVMGIGAMASLPIIAGSAPLAGFLFDATGSYRLAFALQIGVCLIAGLLFVFLRVPKVEPGTEERSPGDSVPQSAGAI